MTCGGARSFPQFHAILPQSSRYDAFGGKTDGTGNVSNKYLFAGEQYDSNLGDYYLRARYYDTDTGRFIRRDSYEGRLSEPLTLHKYVYASDNPITLIDPSGHNALDYSLQSFAAASLLEKVLVGGLIVTGIAIVGLGTYLAISEFIELYVPNFAAQRGKQGDAGDTGIRNEAIERTRAGEAKDIEEALDQLMNEAKQANAGKGDKELQQRIKREQKAQQVRKSRQTKDKKK
jgi:RHS repeat-associated protein